MSLLMYKGSYRLTKILSKVLCFSFLLALFWIILNEASTNIERLGHTIPAERHSGANILKRRKDAHEHEVIDLPDPRNGRGWRWLVSAYLSAIRSEVDFSREIYVFGVAGGNSIESIRKAFSKFGLQMPRIWGFDSFSGIPDETVGVSRPLGWTRGTYDSSVANRSLCKRTNSGGEVCHASAQRLSFKEQVDILDSKLGADRSDTNYIQGFYNESLTTTLYNSLPFKPALFIDIDCDLYISTFQALDWIFKHNLAGPGTLIGYDDWCLTHLGSAGESRAHNEISFKYNVKFRCILGGCTDAMLKPGRKSNYYQMVSSKLLNPIFIIESIGFQAQSGMDLYPEKCISQSKHWIQV